MGRSAGNSWRGAAGAVAMLLPVLMLGGCGSGQDKAMADKLAAAEDAANRAIAAQHAAEKAAADAATAHPAPIAAPTVMADTGLSPDLGGDDDVPDHDDGNQMSLGGEGSTTAPDGTVVPGQGA